MDVLKVFVEEPAALASPAASLGGAALGAAPASLDALLAGSALTYGRAYLAGTHLSDGPPRVGLTALADASAFVAPLVAWAGARPWTHLGRDGALVPLANASDVLARPNATAALALGPTDGAALAAVAAGDRADAIRRLLDAGAAVLVPEGAHDGWDWSIFGPAPLGVVDALRAHPAGPDIVRFAAPLRLARSEHKFYFEQWALDPPPAWAERL